ncbi:hypothetical protein [Actinoplanes sp. NPDC023714]|uniref:hypothetical protein n=1 Tax=Actinoplanes sp. NPDC023714 TaxID=3154322 RepID=UPI0034050BA2
MTSIIISVAGVLVALGALGTTLWQVILLRRQLQHAAQVSSAQFYQNITVQWLEFDKVWLDRPQLWAYFHGDKPPPEEELVKVELMCMSATLSNLAEISVVSEDVLGQYSGDWERYFRYVYVHSPFFRVFWEKYRSLWPKQVSDVFLTPIEDLEPMPDAPEVLLPHGV